jgi:signal transduction histidine kinase
VFDVILMTLGIANQFYQYKKEKEEMLLQYIEQQKSITQKILDTQDRERKRISREMHDDIGAGLTQITLMSESAKESKNTARLDDIANTSRQLVNSIGEIIWSLNPENKTLSHLCAYLREQLNKQLEYSGMRYMIILPEEDKEIILTNEQRRNIILVTKEIVNNAIKYSKAKNISIKAELVNEDIAFTIKDDGVGFDAIKLYAGNGLRNCKNRIEELGGTMEVVAGVDTGSSFTYSVALAVTT